MKLNIGSVSGKRVSAQVIILNGAEVKISTEFGAEIRAAIPHRVPKSTFRTKVPRAEPTVIVQLTLGN